MDFRTAITLGILLVLAVGIGWYERSRPSSRVVALVASLTALAVASRLLLAPIPNIVGTTDVALLTGYSLGGPPGFMVGALAAPISNIWLGQGPWTVWQMAGWGFAGLAGAGLAVVAGRRLGRLGLALACAGMGLVYGALLDLSVMSPMAASSPLTGIWPCPRAGFRSTRPTPPATSRSPSRPGPPWCA